MTRPGRASWPTAAARFSARIGRERLHPGVVEWADGRPGSERWAIALSGGGDSVALLLLLWAHWPERRGRLIALHFDHRLRGAESSADARFCAKLCEGLGIPLVLGRWTGSKASRSEASAREARFAFMDREMARRRIRVLWLGHQQDDIAETVLMRLARGSGTAGLSAPRPIHALGGERGRGRTRFHARPLLSLKKREIASALDHARAPWREDSSNAARAHFRNRLRLGVIPRWVRAAERDALSGAALSRELMEEDDRALEAWTDDVGAVGADSTMSVSRLAGKPRALVRRSLHRWLALQKAAGELSRQGFEALLRSVERGVPARHSLGRHGFAVIKSGRLRFEIPRKTATPH